LGGGGHYRGRQGPRGHKINIIINNIIFCPQQFSNYSAEGNTVNDVELYQANDLFLGQPLLLMAQGHKKTPSLASRLRYGTSCHGYGTWNAEVAILKSCGRLT
jgi:hypothetical protein